MTTTLTPTSLALGDDGEDHPRRLLQIGKDLIAYGGDHGTISLVPACTAAATTTETTALVIRRFDDAVRAVAVSHDLRRVAVGFDDGSTRIFAYEDKMGNDDDRHFFCKSLLPRSSDNVDEAHDFLSQSDGLITCSTDTAPNNNNGQESSFLGPRFDAPVRQLEFDPRSYHLAIATEAGLCIVDVTTSKSLETRYLQEQVEKEHDACGIRGIQYSLDSRNNATTVLLATLAMDGRLCLWDVTAPNEDPLLDYDLVLRDAHKCVAQPDVGEINGADAYDRSMLPVFGLDFLALPGLTDVQLRRLSNLQEQCFLSSVGGQGHIDTIVGLVFSPDNRHLVTSGRDGRVVLWELDPSNEERPIGSFVMQLGQYDSIPTHMVWNRDSVTKEEVLFMAAANGTLRTLRGRDAIVPTNNSSKGNVAETKVSHKRISKSSTSAENDNGSGDDETVDFGHTDSNNEEEAPKKTSKKTSFVVEEAEEDDDDGDSLDVDATAKEGFESAAPVADMDDNIASRRAGEDEASLDDEDDAYDYDVAPSGLASTRRGALMELPEPQPAFAPSSTPLDLTRRIMCWNHMGTISLLQGQDATTRNTVDIEFTDAATRRPISFTDNMNFILGSLGEDGGIFATDLADEDDDLDGARDDDVGEIVEGLNMSERTKALVRQSHRKRMKKTAADAGKSSGSSVYFHRFETFGALRDKDWYLSLPDGERALGCACGEGWAAVMTSRRFLRFFTSGGSQGPVIWLKGEPVTIVGRSAFVAAIYHEGSPLPDGTQKLGYAIFDGVSARQIASGSISSISTRSKLTWAGFSNHCSLMTLDSDGMLSMLLGMTAGDNGPDDVYSWEWAPMLDTVGLRKSADDNFFPITCQDGKLICVPLKGGNEYPDAVRRPVTTALSLRMPFARDALDKSMQMEEISVRANLALTQKKFLNDALALDLDEKGEAEEEYTGLCAQVDKVTLKLFMSIVEAGKLERALDLVERLHLEQSLDIAMTVADRLNHRNLSDRIHSVKERRFAAADEEAMDDFPQEDFTTADNFDEASQQVSPDWSNERKRKIHDDDTWDEPSEKRSKAADKQNHFVKPTNPFAKKKMESPARPSMSPGKTPLSKPALSRLSTFSAQSREKTKSAKRIL